MFKWLLKLGETADFTDGNICCPCGYKAPCLKDIHRWTCPKCRRAFTDHIGP